MTIFISGSIEKGRGIFKSVRPYLITFLHLLETCFHTARALFMYHMSQNIYVHTYLLEIYLDKKFAGVREKLYLLNTI